MIDKCPRCGGESGFRFCITERNLYLGSWGTPAEYTDMDKLIHSPRKAICLDNGCKIDIEIAEGKS